MFAVGQFHNHFKLSSSAREHKERQEVLKMVKRIEDYYAAKRQFKRKPNVEPEDEKSRVRLTLLEYGVRSVARSIGKAADSKASSFNNASDELEQDEVCELTNCQTLIFSASFDFAWNFLLRLTTILDRCRSAYDT